MYVGEGFDRVAYYSCNEGYFVTNGTTARKCTARGTWDGSLIQCQRMSKDAVFFYVFSNNKRSFTLIK